MKRLVSDSKFKILGVYCLVNLLLSLANLKVSSLLFTLFGIGIWIAYNALQRQAYRTALLIWLVLQVLVIRAGDFSFDLALPLQLLAAFGMTSSNSGLNEIYFNLVPLPFIYYYFLKDYFKNSVG